MRTCPVCGTANDPGDDFCGNCGSYLGWSESERGAEPPPDAPDAPSSAPEPVAADDPAPPTPRRPVRRLCGPG
ncbi:zinc-ribbon domain-containing protein [Streptomyces sp. M19]